MPDYQPKKVHKLITTNQVEQIRKGYHIIESKWQDLYSLPEPEPEFEDIIHEIILEALDQETPARKVKNVSELTDIGIPAQKMRVFSPVKEPSHIVKKAFQSLGKDILKISITNEQRYTSLMINPNIQESKNDRPRIPTRPNFTEEELSNALELPDFIHKAIITMAIIVIYDA